MIAEPDKPELTDDQVPLWQRNSVRSVLWVVLSTVLATGMVTTVKYLGTRVGVFQINFFRAFAALIFTLPFILRKREGGTWSRQPGFHLARGLSSSGAQLCVFYSVIHLPLATAISISFAGPLFVLVLAALFLAEVVRARRWTATAVGFVGVLIMLRPTGTVELASLVALGGAFFFGTSVVMVKRLLADDDPTVVIFYYGVIASAIFIGPAIYAWDPLSSEDLGLLALMATFGVAAQVAYIRGLAIAEASELAPYGFLRLLFAAFAGFLFFSEVPDFWTVVGGTVIVGSTIYIARHETVLNDTKSAVPPT